jgi:hypothetical protein
MKPFLRDTGIAAVPLDHARKSSRSWICNQAGVERFELLRVPSPSELPNEVAT